MNKENHPPELSWEININLLKNTGVIKEVLKVLMIAFAIVFVFIFFLWAGDGFPNIIDLGDIKFVGGLLIATILGTVILIKLIGSSYLIAYQLTSRGAKFTTLPNQKRKNKILSAILMGLGLLSKNVTATGVGALSHSRQDMFTDWKKVRKVVYFKRKKEIHLHCKDLTKNILFCTQENVEQVFAMVSYYSKQAKLIIK